MKDIHWIQLAKDLQTEIVSQRRHLHTIPELGFREEKTASFVAEKLEHSGYSVRTRVGKTGVVADLGQAPAVAIRAEMDGLPIADGTGGMYRSLHKGVSHSCSHDVNMACELAGEANVRIVKRKTWTEDYAALLKVTPGSMVLLGGQIQSSKRSHHSAGFDVDESALYVGAAILAATAHRLMLQ